MTFNSPANEWKVIEMKSKKMECRRRKKISKQTDMYRASPAETRGHDK
jgi:hypothetical protein